MAITTRDYQATSLDPGTGAAPAAPAHVEQDPNRVGVVFVHGIGTQQPAETFLDWSRPIVKLLTAWRADRGLSPDPVVRSQFAFSGSSQPYLELDIPKVDDHPARRFIITEAWWAAQVRAPSLGDAAAYVSRGFPKILRGIVKSYQTGDDVWQKRLGQDLERAEAEGRGDTPAIRELKARHRWDWVNTLDKTQRFLSILAYVPALIIGGGLLLLYGPFRLIPIQAIRDAAVLRSVDSFLTSWFGDLPDILDDPVQAANVRSRLAESVELLATRMGCGSIAIIAHSGGAIVSFTTLLDPLYGEKAEKGFEVHRLITIGEGLALGWRLDATGSGAATRLPDRLTGDLVAARPNLQWTDIWSSYDPAPAGPIEAPQGVTLPKIDSRPVTNRMSILEDHGAYWDNDEGFLIPLVRALDQARGDANDSRFFRDSAERAVRIERRRQRVGVLALWRWIVVLGALIPIAASTIAWAATTGAVAGPAGFGRAIGAWFATIPFHDLITAPLAFLSGLANGPASFEALGQWLVGAGVIALAFVVIALVGMRLWSRWDERERDIARREPLGPVDRGDVGFVSAIVLVATIVISAWFLAQAFA